MVASAQEFRPDWASAPGDTITDILSEREISLADFAKRMDQTPEEARELVEGRTTVSIKVARLLESVVGASTEFWMTRDYQYRQDVSRLHAAASEWLSELPLGDMIKFGWLKPKPRPSEETAACLNFFGIPNVAAWREAYGSLQAASLFRTSPSFESRPAAVAAWLRRCEIEAESIACQEWRPERFAARLPEIRALTRLKDPKEFVPKLQRICASCGVAVVVVRLPNGCRASGAARLLSPAKGLIALSFRYLSDDQVWFTFFHEAAHLLLHADRGTFVDGLNDEAALSTDEETEANSLAANVLMPPPLRPALSALPANAREVIAFARKAGIAPGIVEGQLQHVGRLRHNQLNSLKRRFQWEDQVI